MRTSTFWRKHGTNGRPSLAVLSNESRVQVRLPIASVLSTCRLGRPLQGRNNRCRQTYADAPSPDSRRLHFWRGLGMYFHTMMIVEALGLPLPKSHATQSSWPRRTSLHIAHATSPRPPLTSFQSRDAPSPSRPSGKGCTESLPYCPANQRQPKLPLALAPIERAGARNSLFLHCRRSFQRCAHSVRAEATARR